MQAERMTISKYNTFSPFHHLNFYRRTRDSIKSIVRVRKSIPRCRARECKIKIRIKASVTCIRNVLLISYDELVNNYKKKKKKTSILSFSSDCLCATANFMGERSKYARRRFCKDK